MAWSIDEMRAAVKKAYPGKNWAKKVKNMSDGQIFAIFKSLQERDSKPDFKALDGEQMSFTL